MLATQTIMAQASFEYDQAGNRVRRTSPPDLTPIMAISPSTIFGTKPIQVILKVYELNGIATTGPITIRISKDSQIQLTFNPTATSLNGNTLNNSNWSFSDTQSSYYVLSSTTPIAGGNLSAIGLNGTFEVNNTQGSLTVSAVILSGSGGETRLDNNTSTKRIDYFP